MERTTNMQEILSGRNSKNFAGTIAESVLCHPEDFEEVYSLIASPDRKISWRAAWVCDKLSEKRPEWLAPKQQELIDILKSCMHDGTKREILSILYNLPLTEELPVDLLNYCMEHMLAPDEAIAVQALSMHLAYKLCLIEPELFGELQAYLENAERGLYSCGVQTCIKNTLNKINSKRKECSQK